MRLRLAVAPAALAAVSAAFAAVTAVSCGGGATSPTDPLNMRQTPVSGMDPAPTTGDPPPSMYEAPPSMYESPPVMGDPANGGGSGGCFPCKGTFSCTATGVTGSTTLTLSVDTNKNECAVSQTVNGTTETADIPATSACGTNIPLETTGDITIKRTSGGGIKVCVETDGGTEACGTCLPTEASGSGSGGQTSVPVIGGGASTNGGSGCSALATCCNALPSAQQAGCNSVVNLGSQPSCSSVLTGYENSKLCP